MTPSPAPAPHDGGGQESQADGDAQEGMYVGGPWEVLGRAEEAADWRGNEGLVGFLRAKLVMRRDLFFKLINDWLSGPSLR